MYVKNKTNTNRTTTVSKQNIQTQKIIQKVRNDDNNNNNLINELIQKPSKLCA